MRPDLSAERFGALVISLDFELWWGVRDHYGSTDDYRGNLLGAREAVPRMLQIFAESEVAATWATVGFLFASSRIELRKFHPRLRPAYPNDKLNPYGEPTGADEGEDPFRLAPSLVRAIQATPGQEIATHTYSHYYCGEEGQDAAAFDADIAAACAIAAAKGVELRSIVFPRNQHRPEYDQILRRHGITIYRGNPPSPLWRFGNSAESGSAWKRAGRMMDTYLPITNDDTFAWEEIPQANGMANVRASMMLRSYSGSRRILEPLRLARIRRAMREAARRGRVFHLWWHPHNFGRHLEDNLAFLREIVTEYRRLHAELGMRSLSMADAAASVQLAEAS